MTHRIPWHSLCVALAVHGCGANGKPPASLGDEPSDAGSGIWQSQATGEGPLSTSDLAVTVDSSNLPHIAYSITDGGSRVRHAWATASGFASELVDEYGRGRRKAWVRNSADLLLVYDGVSYSTTTFQALRNRSGVWNVDILEVLASSGGASAVWLDDAARVAQVTAVSGTDFPGYPSTALFRQGISWNGEVLAESQTRLTTEPVRPLLAIALDKHRTVHIAYSAPPDDFVNYAVLGKDEMPFTIRYVRVADGVWSDSELLASAPGIYEGLSITTDGADTVHLSFGKVTEFDALTAAAPEVLYMQRKAGESVWKTETIANGRAARGSMDVDSAGNVHVVYCMVQQDDARCHGIAHAARKDEAWLTEIIQGADDCEIMGDAAALAVGRDGSVHVAYEGCDGQLRYARRKAE